MAWPESVGEMNQYLGLKDWKQHKKGL